MVDRDKGIEASKKSRARQDRRRSGGSDGGFVHERMNERMMVWPGDWEECVLVSFAAAPLSTCLSTTTVGAFPRRMRATCWSSDVTVSSSGGVGGPGVPEPLSGELYRVLSRSGSPRGPHFGRFFLSPSFIFFEISACRGET